MRATLTTGRTDFTLKRWAVLIMTAILILANGRAEDAPNNYPAASLQPESQPGWDQQLTTPQLGEPKDEAMAGQTAQGTPIYTRTPECFPAERRNVFYLVDQVAGPDGKLCPIAYDKDAGGKRTSSSEMAVQGQNTWMLWTEGNEAFWGWLQERGYGIVDFLLLIDSTNRENRFEKYGLINQPGMTQSDGTDWLFQNLGLHIDKAASEDVIKLMPPGDEKEGLNLPPTDHLKGKDRHSSYPYPPYPALFDAVDEIEFPDADFKLNDVIAHLPNDGVDPTVYGYPSGVVGLRLFPNPDFFGKTEKAKTARQLWYNQVVKAKDNPDRNYYKIKDEPNDRDYKVEEIHDDPNLTRPFRVGMSCAFCHVGFHPLDPPLTKGAQEHPDWKNLSSVIGNQYWNPGQAFANTSKSQSFVTYFVHSQQAGTIDTSLVSTDNINNPNTINSVFQVPARLQRAGMKISDDWNYGVRPTERQSAANLLMPGKEDGIETTQPRHTPAVLLDGSDSIGVFGALARVYLNIGTFPEEWGRCDNPVIGFTPQKPFSIATLRQNSVYWQASEAYRVPYLAAFFTFRTSEQNASTAPMKLKNADWQDDGSGLGLTKDETALAHGRTVFLQNCAICHSSKQPENFDLAFDRDWQKKDAQIFDGAGPKATPPEPHYYVPMDYDQWTPFTESKAYKDYVTRITKLANPATFQAPLKPANSTFSIGSSGTTTAPATATPASPTNPGDQSNAPAEDFFENNYLSTDIRIPITLVGTNSGRAVGTNGMRGQVWDNFSSDTYKELPAVGRVHFYNPFSVEEPDRYGNNDVYYPPSNGPGYYRPASLVSIWATAPFLHNNSLGVFNQDPTVKGRLIAFKDAINKLLSSPEERTSGSEADDPTVDNLNAHRDGDLRFGPDRVLARNVLGHPDPGFVYRTPHLTWLVMQPKFIYPLLEGILGPSVAALITEWIWIALAIIFLGLIFVPGQGSTGGFIWALLGVVLTGLLATTGFYYLYWWTWLFWLLPLVAFVLALTLLTQGADASSDVHREIKRNVVAGRWSHGFFLLVTVALGGFVCGFTHGKLGPLVIGPFPKGTPVNLVMNFNPQGPLNGQVNAVSGLARAFFKLNVEHLNLEPKDPATAAHALKIFNDEAGKPLLRASKCPDFVLDRGHWFGERITNKKDRDDLIEFLKTL